MDFLISWGGVHGGDLATSAFWMTVGSIILVNLLLSGDNAILIAMACRNLPENLRGKGILWGTLGAIVLRMAMGGIVIYLMKIPFLQIVGASLLIWIAVNLLIQEENHEEVAAPDKLWAAVKTIIIADAVMSLDNVLAVAGVADGKPLLLWFGLLISIPMVVYGSNLLITLIDRFPWVLYLGAGILGLAAGEMILEDPIFHTLNLGVLHMNGKVLGGLIAVLIIGSGYWINTRKRKLKEVEA